MTYSTGEDMRPGDRIRFQAMTGELVVLIDAGQATASFTAEDWAYLGSGVLIETKEAGLIHVPDPVELAFVGRAEDRA